jgi:hypothetical protein
VTFGLHLLQPTARLAGRLGHGLVPWRRPGRGAFAAPVPRRRASWSESWRAPEARLAELAARLREGGRRVRTGGPCDRWDLELSGGALGGARIVAAVEEHGRGRQLMRCRLWPRIPRALVPVLASLAASAGAAVHAGALVAGAVLATAAVMLAVAAVAECGMAVAGVLAALEER